MKKILSAVVAAVYFSVNCALVHSAEANFWSSRRVASQQVKGETAQLEEGATVQRGNVLLAQLPMASPVDLARGKVDTAQAPGDAARTPFSIGPAAGDWLGKMVSPFGSVRNVYISPKKDAPFIVHIQDGHGIEEAQRNISSMIEIVGQDPKINLVGLEAAWGPFSLQPYRDYPDANITKEIAEFFLKKGLIAGPEYAGLTLSKSPDFFGAENKELYDANVQALKTAYKTKQAAHTQLSVLVNNVANLKNQRYSDQLKIFDAHFEGYHSEKEKLAVYARYLVETNMVVRAVPSVPNLELLVRALDEEGRLNFKLVEKERRDLVEQLANKLTVQQMQNLVAKSMDYRAGRVGYGEYHSHLIDICRQYGISVGQWGHLNRYISYVMLADKIDKNGLLEEMDFLDRAIPERLARTADEKKLVAIAYDLTLMAKLLRHEMAPTDWAIYEKRADEIHRLADRLAEVDHTNKWESLSAKTLKPFEEFCSYATQRNNALADNLLRRMEETRAKSAVLVTGGFHTEGLSALLRDKQVSYVVLTPKITEIPRDNKYLDLLASDPVPLEKQLAGDRIYLAKVVGMTEKSTAGLMAAIQHVAQLKKALVDMGNSYAITSDEGYPGAKVLFELSDGRKIHLVTNNKGGKPVSARFLENVRPVIQWAGRHSVAIENALLIIGLATMSLAFGNTSTDLLAAVFAGSVGPYMLNQSNEKLGDLTKSEIDRIQSVVDKTGVRLFVVGSAAKGQRRGVGTDLPLASFGVNKKGSRSDIDYATVDGMDELADLASLPDVDPSFGVRGLDYINLKNSPAIEFVPNQNPIFHEQREGRLNLTAPFSLLSRDRLDRNFSLAKYTNGISSVLYVGGGFDLNNVLTTFLDARRLVMMGKGYDTVSAESVRDAMMNITPQLEVDQHFLSEYIRMSVEQGFVDTHVVEQLKTQRYFIAQELFSLGVDPASVKNLSSGKGISFSVPGLMGSEPREISVEFRNNNFNQTSQFQINVGDQQFEGVYSKAVDSLVFHLDSIWASLNPQMAPNSVMVINHDEFTSKPVFPDFDLQRIHSEGDANDDYGKFFVVYRMTNQNEIWKPAATIKALMPLYHWMGKTFNREWSRIPAHEKLEQIIEVYAPVVESVLFGFIFGGTLALLGFLGIDLSTLQTVGLWGAFNGIFALSHRTFYVLENGEWKEKSLAEVGKSTHLTLWVASLGVHLPLLGMLLTPAAFSVPFFLSVFVSSALSSGFHRFYNYGVARWFNLPALSTGAVQGNASQNNLASLDKLSAYFSRLSEKSTPRILFVDQSGKLSKSVADQVRADLLKTNLKLDVGYASGIDLRAEGNKKIEYDMIVLLNKGTPPSRVLAHVVKQQADPRALTVDLTLDETTSDEKEFAVLAEFSTELISRLKNLPPLRDEVPDGLTVSAIHGFEVNIPNREMLLRVIHDAYQRGELKSFVSFFGSRVSLEDVVVELERVAQETLKSQLLKITERRLPLVPMESGEGTRMKTFKSGALPGYVIKVPKRETNSGIPIDFEKEILPGYWLAKNNLGELFVMMLLENLEIDLGLDSSKLQTNHIIVQKELTPLDVVIKNAPLNEQDALTDKLDKDLDKLYLRMAERGIVDLDVGNRHRNYGYSDDGINGLDVDNLQSMERLVNSGGVYDQDYFGPLWNAFENGKNKQLGLKRIRDPFEHIIIPQQLLVLDRLVRKDGVGPNNIFYFIFRLFTSENIAKAWGMRLLPVEIGLLGGAGWFATGWAQVVFGALALDPTLMGAALMAAGIVMFRGLHFALEKVWARSHPAQGPPSNMFWINTARMMPYAMLPVLVSSPIAFLIAFSVLAYNHFAFDLKQLFNMSPMAWLGLATSALLSNSRWIPSYSVAQNFWLTYGNHRGNRALHTDSRNDDNESYLIDGPHSLLTKGRLARNMQIARQTSGVKSVFYLGAGTDLTHVMTSFPDATHVTLSGNNYGTITAESIKDAMATIETPVGRSNDLLTKYKETVSNNGFAGTSLVQNPAMQSSFLALELLSLGVQVETIRSESGGEISFEMPGLLGRSSRRVSVIFKNNTFNGSPLRVNTGVEFYDGLFVKAIDGIQPYYNGIFSALADRFGSSLTVVSDRPLPNSVGENGFQETYKASFSDQESGSYGNAFEVVKLSRLKITVRENQRAALAVISLIQSRGLAKIADNLRPMVSKGDYRLSSEFSEKATADDIGRAIRVLEEESATVEAAVEYGRRLALADGVGTEQVAVLHGILSWEQKTRDIALAVVRGMLLAGKPVLIVAEEGFDTKIINYTGQTSIEFLNVGELTSGMMDSVESRRINKNAPLSSTVLISEEHRHILDGTNYSALTFEGISRAIQNAIETLIATLRAA